MIKYNISLHGNSKVWHKLVNDSLTSKLAHAYLFAGPQGIGKFSMAKEFIKLLLKADESLAKRIDANNYLDILCLSKQDKNEIGIDLIRKANNFLAQTPAEGDKKFLIIDSADDLNLNSANALLKILEEPRNNNFIFLISHSPYSLLKTIRSRCRIIKFSPLSSNELRLIVQNDATLYLLDDYIAGSAAKALSAANQNISNLYLKLLELIETNNIQSFNQFIENNLKHNWPLITELVTHLLSRCIKIKVNYLAKIDETEQEILKNIIPTKSLENWFKLHDKWIKSISDAEIYNLDKRQILLITLENIRSKEIL